MATSSSDSSYADRTVFNDGLTSITDDPSPARQLAARWQGLDRLVVAGRGLAYAAALETALKIKETTGILAEGNIQVHG